MSDDNQLEKALADKDYQSIYVLLKERKNLDDIFIWEEVLRGACESHHTDLALLLIEKGVDVNLGLDGACSGGHLDLCQLMIDKGADLNFGLVVACFLGNLNLAYYVIEKGANIWNDGLFSACDGNNKDLAQLMIDKGANDWNGGLYRACRNNHRDMVQMMIDNGANDWNRGLEYACEQNHVDMVHFMIDKGANDWGAGLKSACKSGHTYLAQLMIEKGKNMWKIGQLNDCLRYACCESHIDIVRMLIKHGANNLLSCAILVIFCNHDASLMLYTLNCVPKKKRKAFIIIIKRKITKKSLYYLINRHGIPMAQSIRLSKRSIIYNINQSFICNDVAKFVLRFAGQDQFNKYDYGCNRYDEVYNVNNKCNCAY